MAVLRGSDLEPKWRTVHFSSVLLRTNTFVLHNNTLRETDRALALLFPGAAALRRRWESPLPPFSPHGVGVPCAAGGPVGPEPGKSHRRPGSVGPIVYTVNGRPTRGPKKSCAGKPRGSSATDRGGNSDPGAGRFGTLQLKCAGRRTCPSAACYVVAYMKHPRANVTLVQVSGKPEPVRTGCTCRNCADSLLVARLEAFPLCEQ